MIFFFRYGRTENATTFNIYKRDGLTLHTYTRTLRECLAITAFLWNVAAAHQYAGLYSHMLYICIRSWVHSGIQWSRVDWSLVEYSIWKVIYHNLIINSHSIINQSKLHWKCRKCHKICCMLVATEYIADSNCVRVVRETLCCSVRLHT